MTDYEKGYDAAIDDVEKAMEQAVVTEAQHTFNGEIVLNYYNHPALFVEKLKALRAARFPQQPPIDE